jgi:hypothetical protein
MAISEYDEWISLGKAFASIDPNDFLGLAWEYDSAGNRYWYSLEWCEPSVYAYASGDRPIRSLTEARFKAHCAKGAAMLWSDVKKTDLWFLELKLSSQNDRPGNRQKHIDPINDRYIPVITGLIRGVCKRAEELCYRVCSNPESYRTIEGMLDRVFAEEIESETDREMGQNSLPEVRAGTTGCDRSSEVKAFLSVCNLVSETRIHKRHIWLSIGHQTPRQFEYWQSCNEKATKADSENFSRVLKSGPAAFLETLRLKRLIK